MRLSQIFGVLILACISIGAVFASFLAAFITTTWMDADIVIPGKLVATVSGTIVFILAVATLAAIFGTAQEVIRYKKYDVVWHSILEFGWNWKFLIPIISAAALGWFIGGVSGAAVGAAWSAAIAAIILYMQGRAVMMTAIGDLYYKSKPS